MDEHCGQRHALALPARERADFLVEVGNAQPAQDALGLVFVQRAEFRGMPGEHLLQHGQIVVHDRHLRQIRDLHVGVARHAARVRFLDAGQYLQKRALARAVHADQANALAGAEIERNAAQERLHAVILVEIFRGQQHSRPSIYLALL